MGKDAFKIFVRNNPNLIDYVTSNKMTWQQFYEIYDLYGEDSSIWDNFKNINSNSTSNTVKDFINMFKDLDTDTINKAVTSISKVIEALKGFTKNDHNEPIYDERPKYKYFED